MDKFSVFNFVMFSFGLMNLGLSYDSYSNNILGNHISTSFLYLGLILCLPSLVALGLTMLARKGMRTGKMILLLPLMVFLTIVPMLMASLILISLVLRCQDATVLMNNKNTPFFYAKVGMEFLLIFFFFVTFLGWLGYFWLAISIMNKLEMIFYHTQDTTERSGQGLQEVLNGELDVVDVEVNSPPAYDDLFVKSEEEDDTSLPCYRIACEIEAAQQEAVASNKVADYDVVCEEETDDEIVCEEEAVNDNITCERENLDETALD